MGPSSWARDWSWALLHWEHKVLATEPSGKSPGGLIFMRLTILFPLWSGSLYFSLSIICLSVSSSFLFPHSTPGSFQRTSGIPFVSFSFITSKENLCHCIPCMIFLSSGSPGGQTVGENGLEAVTLPILSSRENADGHPWKPSEWECLQPACMLSHLVVSDSLWSHEL